jgi:hypothetical protein
MILKPLSLSLWVRYTWLGWIIGLFPAIAFLVLLDALKVEVTASIGLGMGGGVGLMQWVILRKYIVMGRQWLWYSILGMTSSYLLFDLVQESLHLSQEYYLPFATLLGALVTSFFQHHYILSGHTTQSRRWMLFSCLGWLLSHVVLFAIAYFSMQYLPETIAKLVNMAAMLSGGLVLGVVTGLAIVPLLKHTTQSL